MGPCPVHCLGQQAEGVASSSGKSLPVMKMIT